MSNSQQLNSFLTDIFNRITKIEEQALATGLESDISITEIHIIEKIGDMDCARMSTIAKALNVTLATLTVACDKLNAKGLINRTRDAKDKRVVNLTLSPKGRVAYKYHQDFHHEMVETVIDGLSEKEAEILTASLMKLQEFFDPNKDTKMER